MGNKQVMHRFHPLVAWIVAVLILGAAGCGAPPGGAGMPSFLRLYVADPVGGEEGELKACSAVVHDTAVRTLQAQGFTVVAESAQADATLWAIWSQDAQGRVSLHLSLEQRGGRPIFTSQAMGPVVRLFLSEKQVADAVRVSLLPLRVAPQQVR